MGPLGDIVLRDGIDAVLAAGEESASSRVVEKAALQLGEGFVSLRIHGASVVPGWDIDGVVAPAVLAAEVEEVAYGSQEHRLATTLWAVDILSGVDDPLDDVIVDILVLECLGILGDVLLDARPGVELLPDLVQLPDPALVPLGQGSPGPEVVEGEWATPGAIGLCGPRP